MHDISDLKIAIIGLGYVGLPLLAAFSGKVSVRGFDIDQKRVHELQKALIKQMN